MLCKPFPVRLHWELVMQVFKVGQDELSEFDFENVLRNHQCQWIVYWYCREDHEGWGELIALGMDGSLYCKSLGHCSCFGPLDEWEEAEKVPIEEFLRAKDSIHDVEHRKEVDLMVRYLLSGH